MTCNNPKLDLAKMNAYFKFGEILPFGSQNIEGKRNFGINKGPYLWYKFQNNNVSQLQARSCQYECIYKIW